MSDNAELLKLADRGQTVIVDLREDADPADAAARAIDTLALQCREPDEFILDAHQEQELGVPIGRLKLLFGYPARVIYHFDED